MKTDDILLILLSFISLGYLIYAIYLPPQLLEVDSIQDLPENTQILLPGNPEKVQRYGDGVRFYIKDIEIRASSLEALKETNVTVAGYVSEYNGVTYVDALWIEYDN